MGKALFKCRLLNCVCMPTVIYMNRVFNNYKCIIRIRVRSEGLVGLHQAHKSGAGVSASAGVSIFRSARPTSALHYFIAARRVLAERALALHS